MSWCTITSLQYILIPAPEPSLSLPPSTPDPPPPSLPPPPLNKYYTLLSSAAGHAQHGPHASVADVFSETERERAGEEGEHVEEREEEWG